MRNIEKITWNFGTPATWIGIYKAGEVPFACLACKSRTAEYRADIELTDVLTITAILCPDCIRLHPVLVADMCRERR